MTWFIRKIDMKKSELKKIIREVVDDEDFDDAMAMENSIWDGLDAFHQSIESYKDSKSPKVKKAFKLIDNGMKLVGKAIDVLNK